MKTGQSVRADLFVCGDFEFTMKRGGGGWHGGGGGEEGGAQLKGPTTVATDVVHTPVGCHRPG